MKKVIYISGITGSGKTTALKKLAGDSKTICLSIMTEYPIKLITDPDIYIDDYTEDSDKDKLQLLLENPHIKSITIATR